MSEKDMVISERYLRNKLEDTEALLAAAQRTIEALEGAIRRQLDGDFATFSDRMDALRAILPNNGRQGLSEMSDKTRAQISNDAAHDTFRLAENEILRLRAELAAAQRTIDEQADQIESLQHDVWLARM